MDENSLVMLQVFGFLVGDELGMALLVMHTAKFEQDVILSGDQFHLCMTITSTVHSRTSERQDPLARPFVVLLI